MAKLTYTFIFAFCAFALQSQTTFTKCELANWVEFRDVDYGDLNNDGYLDFVATSDDGGVHAFLNEIIGYNRVLLLQTIEPSFLRIVDLDNDGNLDIIVLTRDDNSLIIFKANDGLTLSYEVDEYNFGMYPHAMTVSDMNGDSLADIFISFGSSQIVYIINEGNFEFTQNLSFNLDVGFANDIDVVDLDQDGHMDILTNDSALTIHLNDGTSLAFEKTVVSDSILPGAVAAGDLTNDGLIDIAATTLRSGLVLYVNTGQGYLESTIDPDLKIGRTLEFADIDNDNELELIVNENDKNLYYFDNNNGIFDKVLISNSETFSNPLRIFDFDNDKDLDILTSVFLNGNILVFKNENLSALDEDLLLSDISVYPNPAFNQLNVETDLKVHAINVYNISAQKVLSSKKLKLDISGLPSGAYIMELITDTKSFKNKFLKK